MSLYEKMYSFSTGLGITPLESYMLLFTGPNQEKVTIFGGGVFLHEEVAAEYAQTHLFAKAIEAKTEYKWDKKWVNIPAGTSANFDNTDNPLLNVWDISGVIDQFIIVDDEALDINDLIDEVGATLALA